MSRIEALGEQREVTLDQGTVRYRERGSGEPIVFVHGVLVNGDLWRGVVPLLADQGFRCITPDLPLGAHEVPLREDADLTPPGLARLIADFVRALEVEGATVVANDTGGALSQIAAVNHPEIFGRLVLTSCDAYEHFFPVMFKYLRAMAYVPGSMSLLRQSVKLKAVRRAPMALGWLTRQDPPQEVLDSWTEPLRDSGVRRDVMKVLRGIDKRHTLAAAERLAEFHRPVLLAWAAADKVFPLSDAQKLASAFPDARLRTIQDSLSFVPEDQPEELARMIAEFIRETEPARSAA
ncbi:MAG: hypothetical protein QOK25_1532 [Thermoleophilaceae bacterium]|nr:hypothetical protein [Thermoleophilaceae bacterium]